MTPAVVIGDELNALGIVRSLGTAGVPVIKVVTHPHALSAQSRYGKKMVVTQTEGESLVEKLLELSRQLPGKPVLFVTEEKTVRTISQSRDRLLDCYRFRMPRHDRLMTLMHKQGFQELAEAAGAPIPAVVQLQSVADIPKLQQLSYPCVLKPTVKDYAYGARFAKAYIVQSSEEAAARYLEIAPVCSDLVVQQWIEGGDDDIYFCLQYVGDQGPVASFTGRKLRSWPPRIGGTASCTAAWEVATLNGVNIPLAAYRFETGQPTLPVTRPSRDMAWREPLIDRWSQEQQPDTVPRGLGEANVVDAYFRLSDPLPWVHWMGERVGQRWHYLRTRLAGKQ